MLPCSFMTTTEPALSVRMARTYPDPTSKMARTGPLGEPAMLPFGSWCRQLVSMLVVSEEKTSVGCWTPIVFTGDRRRVADAVALTALVYDLDQHPSQHEVNLDFERLRASGLRWMAHTSHSHGELRDGREHVAWRLLVPLDTWLQRSQGETCEHFKARANHVSGALVKRVGLRGVFKLSDLARVWFLPAVHPARVEGLRIAGGAGEPARLVDLLSDYREPKVEPFKPPATGGQLNPERVSKALDALRKTWPSVPMQLPARNYSDYRGSSASQVPQYGETRLDSVAGRHLMRLGLVGVLCMAGLDDEQVEAAVRHVYSAVGDDAEYKTAEALEHTRHQIEQGANVLTWGPLQAYYRAHGYRGQWVMMTARQGLVPTIDK